MMAVQRLILIHPREFKIPTIKDINPITNMKALPEDSEKTQDDEVENIIEEEDDVSNDKALQEDEPQDM